MLISMTPYCRYYILEVKGTFILLIRTIFEKNLNSKVEIGIFVFENLNLFGTVKITSDAKLSYNVWKMDI